MKIEDVLEHLLATQKINNGWTSFSVEECELLSDYISDLQRKEYNNSKAIEYILQNCEIIRTNDEYGNFTDKVGMVEGIPVLNILEGNNE